MFVIRLLILLKSPDTKLCVVVSILHLIVGAEFASVVVLVIF